MLTLSTEANTDSVYGDFHVCRLVIFPIASLFSLLFPFGYSMLLQSKYEN